LRRFRFRNHGAGDVEGRSRSVSKFVVPLRTFAGVVAQQKRGVWAVVSRPSKESVADRSFSRSALPFSWNCSGLLVCWSSVNATPPGPNICEGHLALHALVLARGLHHAFLIARHNRPISSTATEVARIQRALGFRFAHGFIVQAFEVE